MKRRDWLTAFILAGVSVVLTACANPDPTPEPATAVAETAAAVEDVESALALANTAWELESFGDTGDKVPVVPDTYPSLHFMLERYSGYTGCDWFLGIYGVEGSTLRMETPDSTMYGCGEDEGALIEQAATYAVALENITRYELADGQLFLYTVEDQLLVTMRPLESLPFEGTNWDLKFFSTEPAYWVPHIPETLITAQFEGGQLSGSAGCNEYTAAYTRNGPEFMLSELWIGQDTCDEPDGIMDQENEYLSMLASAGAIIESARSLELLTADGTPMLLYHGRQE